MTEQVSKIGEGFAVTFTADELRDLGVRDGGLISEVTLSLIADWIKNFIQ